MQPKNRRYKGYNIFFKNDFETDFLINEIFVEECYWFKADNMAPIIVDCGAHIGISILYFKNIYPDSKIIAFEPDKNSFELLKKNIEYNNLNNVTLHNSAISDFEGKATMYGDFSQYSESVGNTLMKNWGDRNGFTTSSVSTVELSETIKNKTVDYLKIDTEGTELAVLKSIEQYFFQIKNIYVEFHEYDNNKDELLKVTEILEVNGFHASVNRINLADVLSQKYPNWVKKYKPALYKIKGIK